MKKPDYIAIADFFYDLPDERIAKYPLKERDSSKLLVYRDGVIEERVFSDAAEILSEDVQLFFNSTRVVQARLRFKKATGAAIEIFCLEPYRPADYQIAFSSTQSVEFVCLVGNAKKWKDEALHLDTGTAILSAIKKERKDDKFIIEFSWDNDELSFGEILTAAGSTPIPPYLRRDAEKADAETYQTVYAEKEGSVAAPTAGLHFTNEVIDRMKTKGIEVNELVLHVGAGTFIPVKDENAVDHGMHAEMVYVDKCLLQALAARGKKRIAVGTTSTRSLESIYWLGLKAMVEEDFSFENLFLEQWEAYGLGDRLLSIGESPKTQALKNRTIANGEICLSEAVGALLEKMDEVGIDSFSFHTRIMITPGYKFRVIEGLFTNFHQPKSTLLLLISAIVGDDWKKIYSFAMDHEFRFLSYGDSSLLYCKK